MFLLHLIIIIYERLTVVYISEANFLSLNVAGQR